MKTRFVPLLLLPVSSKLASPTGLSLFGKPSLPLHAWIGLATRAHTPTKLRVTNLMALLSDSQSKWGAGILPLRPGSWPAWATFVEFHRRAANETVPRLDESQAIRTRGWTFRGSVIEVSWSPRRS